ncbi:MAG: Naringenin-chalcone synthase [Chlamydiia bacterium]|nr:Naringenin-chalcone synthase [Chlamydiia bacterium]
MNGMRAFECVISDFQHVRPQYESSQKDTLEWIIKAHTQAESYLQGDSLSTADKNVFCEKLRERLFHVGCKPGVIQKRGHHTPDFLHENWQDMQVYRLAESVQGIGLQARQKLHAEIADKIFDELYEKEVVPPSNLIHVSCTGYASPSGAQRVVSTKNWGEEVMVTHAYHMGCYAAIPALRMASAYLSQRKDEKDNRSDIVHTELCTLHFNPLQHTSDQLVAQSLFADGFIKYSVVQQSIRPSLRILAVYEQILPECLDAMSWLLTDWGFQLLLSKEIPALIAKNVKKFVGILCQQARITEAELIEQGIFAIHPGGPKILEYIQKIFGIKPEQLRHSRSILEQYGNMSSATLPHIWEAICQDEKVAKNTKIISLAFGPGLTIAGALLEKTVDKERE